MAERLTCADCGARTRAPATRCPRCGGARLLAPPDLLSRPWAIGFLIAISGGIILAITLLALATFTSILAGTGIELPFAQERRLHSLDDQLFLIRDAERSLPPYPGSQRVSEVHGAIADGAARTIAVCWQTTAAFDTVRAYFLNALHDPASGWQAVGGSTRLFRKGRVYLALTPAESSRPPCAGAYQLNYSYQVP